MSVIDDFARSGTPLCDKPADSASVCGLGSGDLCIPYRRVHDGTWGYLWGDCWRGPGQSGDYLGSPLILLEDDFDPSGARPIEFTRPLPGDRPAGQLFDYRHHADNGFGVTEVSRIPNDAIEFGGRTFVQYTSVHTWVPRDSDTDGSAFSGIAYSDDYGVSWQDFGHRWPGAALGINGNPYGMWTFAGIDPDGYLYIFAKPWNGSHHFRHDRGGIQLFRYDPADFFRGDFAAQQNWAHIDGEWGWYPAARHAPTPIFGPGNNLGEFSVKRIGPVYVMSYFDCTGLSVCTRTAPRPDALWSAAKTQVVHDATASPAYAGLPQLPNLYGGYLHPGSSAPDNLTVVISRWTGIAGSGPYTTTQWTGLSA